MTEEHLESVPWSTLLDTGPPTRSRMIYLGAGAVVVFAIAAVVTKALWKPEVAEVAALPPAPVTAPREAAPPQALLSEADLMASLDAEAHRGAAVFAEWFVNDFFTVDGDSQTVEDVLAALPPDLDRDLLPHGRTAGTSYVEWAAASRVVALSPGRFEVTVLFRTIAADPGADFTRLPVRAVSVPLDMSSDGGFRLTDLPTAVGLPSRPDVPSWSEPTGEAPGSALPPVWGGSRRVLGADAGASGARFLTLETMAGNVGPGWPLVATG